MDVWFRSRTGSLVRRYGHVYSIGTLVNVTIVMCLQLSELVQGTRLAPRLGFYWRTVLPYSLVPAFVARRLHNEERSPETGVGPHSELSAHCRGNSGETASRHGVALGSTAGVRPPVACVTVERFVKLVQQLVVEMIDHGATRDTERSTRSHAMARTTRCRI